jgi:hypothetical protein
MKRKAELVRIPRIAGFLTEQELATQFGISRRTCARLRKSGKLRACRVSKWIVYAEKDISLFLDELRCGGSHE